MTFGTPQALWLFLLVPVYVWMHYKSFSDMGPVQRRISLALRLLLLTAVIFSLADTRLIRHSDKLSVFFLWDGSHSMGEGSDSKIADFIHKTVANSKPKTDSAGVIAFGRDALVEDALGSDLTKIEGFQSDLKPDFTDISRAINLAIASAPQDSATRIVLLSDGNENLGDAITSARIAANKGVEIATVPLGEPTKGEVNAGRIILPRRVQENEMFDVRAVIDSQAETDATVEIYENDKLIGSQGVHLAVGKNVFSFPRKQTEGGFYSYRVQVIAKGDTESANNTATDYTIVQGAPRVCFVTGDKMEAPSLVNALKKEGIQSEFRDISGLPTSLIDLAQYDVVYFSDVGAELLMPETMKAYQSFVRDLGGGFVMLGGQNSFGPGGYFKTPIEDMLPVSMDLSQKNYMPSIAIVVVLDKSGSMAETESGGVEKVEIAKSACSLVVDLLERYDEFGVVGFDSYGQWVVPLEKVTSPEDIKAQIGTMRAGGGTDMYPPMLEAYNALQGADTKIKHMIVLSDGMTAPGAFDGLVAEMNNAGITISTIAIGSDANVDLMEKLAQDGGGNYYFCNDINAVPQIFTKETFLAANRAIVEEPFQAMENQNSPVTEDIDWKNSPGLLGYVATTIKPMATEALVTHKNDPLLAHWQYGLGRSMAFTSDAKSHWAAGWLMWPGYEQFWTKATRWLVGGALQGNLLPNIYLKAGKAHISVDAIDSKGEMITDAILKARVVMPDLSVSEVDLFQVAPGRYEAALDATQIGSYLVSIFQQDNEGLTVDQVSSGFSVSYPPEYEKAGPDLFLLSQLASVTGGELGIAPENVFKHTNQPIARYIDLWYYLLLFAICLLPFDIAVRRLSLTGESLAYVKQRILNTFTAASEARERARSERTHIDQLKKVKDSYRLDSKRHEVTADDLDRKETLERLRSRTGSVDSKSKTELGGQESISSGSSRTSKPPAASGGDEVGQSSMDRLKRAKKRVWSEEHPDDKKPDE
jgi:uncharacterized membrane protein